MLRQPKIQSVILFIISLINIGLSFYLITLDWFEWRISTNDIAREGYRIEVISQKFDGAIIEEIFPFGNIDVYSPAGKCMHLDAEWIIPDLDVKKQYSIFDLFSWAAVLSLACSLAAFANLLWRWWNKRGFVIFLPLIIFATIVVLRSLGPRISIEPDFSMYDFDCTYLVNVKAELVSVSQKALNVFGIIVLTEITIVATVLRNFAKRQTS